MAACGGPEVIGGYQAVVDCSKLVRRALSRAGDVRPAVPPARSRRAVVPCVRRGLVPGEIER